MDIYQAIKTMRAVRQYTDQTIEGKPLQDVLATTGRKPLAELVYRERWGNA